MIEVGNGNGVGPSKPWQGSNPFQEGESSPRLETFRDARQFLYSLLWGSPHSIENGFKAGFDFTEAYIERQRLFFSLIYDNGNFSRGDGSDVSIVPGFMGNKFSYMLPQEKLRRAGWDAEVYPPRYGVHVGSTEKEIDPFVDYLKKRKKQSGKKGHVIAHSKGGHVALTAAIFRTEEFTNCVDQLILVGSPIPDKVNFQVGSAYLALQVILRGNDFRLTVFADDKEALSRLDNLRLTTLKIHKDPIIDGLHLGSEDEIFEVKSSHSGALHNSGNLLFIAQRLARPIEAKLAKVA